MTKHLQSMFDAKIGLNFVRVTAAHEGNFEQSMARDAQIYKILTSH